MLEVTTMAAYDRWINTGIEYQTGATSDIIIKITKLMNFIFAQTSNVNWFSNVSRRTRSYATTSLSENILDNIDRLYLGA